MRERRLSAEERAAWERLAATALPLGRARGASLVPPPLPPETAAVATPPRTPALTRSVPRMPGPPADTLDGGWDRRLRRGVVAPDRALDLHGHTLASAQATLETALGDAVASGVRLLLVVTGKPPRGGEGRRGLIRASIFDWLAHSRHADRVAAVRNAHPRHGGAGALYLILRRTRGG